MREGLSDRNLIILLKFVKVSADQSDQRHPSREVIYLSGRLPYHE